MAHITKLTTYGASLIAAAIAANTPVALATMAVGDGGGSPITPDESALALSNETFRAAINAVSSSANRILVELVVPGSSGGYTIREVGIFDTTGKLVAIASFPETEKPAATSSVARDMVIRIVLTVSGSVQVTLTIDPSAVLITQSAGDGRWVKLADKATQALAESGTDNNAWMTPLRTAQAIAKQVPAATEDTAGRVKMATIAETVAGNDGERATTAKGVKAAIASHAASTDHFPIGTRLLFAQASAPTGWTQITTDVADNRMLRVVKTAGYGVGGTHSPIINNVVPAHTHGFTTGNQSGDHTHSGWTGDQSADHHHYLTVPLNLQDTDRGGDTSYFSVDNPESTATSGSSNGHYHYITTGGTSAGHTHSGSTDNGSSPTNWQPRHLDLILCQKV